MLHQQQLATKLAVGLQLPLFPLLKRRYYSVAESTEMYWYKVTVQKAVVERF